MRLDQYRVGCREELTQVLERNWHPSENTLRTWIETCNARVGSVTPLSNPGGLCTVSCGWNQAAGTDLLLLVLNDSFRMRARTGPTSSTSSPIAGIEHIENVLFPLKYEEAFILGIAHVRSRTVDLILLNAEDQRAVRSCTRSRR